MVTNHAGAHVQVLVIDTVLVVVPRGAEVDERNPSHAHDRARGLTALVDHGALRPRVEGRNHTKVDTIRGGDHLVRHATRILHTLKRNTRSHIDISPVVTRMQRKTARQ